MNNSTTISGISFIGILTIVFIVLKLTHVITWTWFWVLSPLWILFALISVLLLFALIIYCTVLIVSAYKRKKYGFY